MNEQIRQLADHAKAYANQCTKDYDGDVSWYWMDYYTEKFAELIVRECAKIADTAEPFQSNDLILKHFGVEE
jgi:hypothetical protein